MSRVRAIPMTWKCVLLAVLDALAADDGCGDASMSTSLPTRSSACFSRIANGLGSFVTLPARMWLPMRIVGTPLSYHSPPISLFFISSPSSGRSSPCSSTIHHSFSAPSTRMGTIMALARRTVCLFGFGANSERGHRISIVGLGVCGEESNEELCTAETQGRPLPRSTMLGLIRSKGLARAASSQAQRVLGARAASTVGGALDEAVERLPHKEAFRSLKQDLRWSYKELDGFVQEVANGFASLKLQPGDVLAVWLPNNAENYVTQLAAAKAGLTLAVIDPEISTAEDIEYILHDTKASGIVYEPKVAGRNQAEVIHGLFPELATYRGRQEVFRPKNFRNLHTVISTGFDYEEGVVPFRQIRVNSPEPHTVAAVKKAISAKTPLAVTYSKVAGQKPKKSEVLTHSDVLKRAGELTKNLSLTVEDKICLTSEEQGLSFAPVAAIEQSALVIIPSVEFDQEAVKYAIQIESPSIIGSGAANFKRI